MKIAGGCLCGQARYEADVEPVFQALCYCRDCLKSTGAGHYPGLGVPAASLTIIGELSDFAKKGASGTTVVRRFCPLCGSTIVDDNGSGVIVVAAGTLDDPSIFKPTSAVFTQTRPDWSVLPVLADKKS